MAAQEELEGVAVEDTDDGGHRGQLVFLSINKGFVVEGEREAYQYDMTRLFAVNPSAIDASSRR